MSRDSEIRSALQRAQEIVEADPSRATGTISLKLEMGEAIKCVTRAENWTLELDEPKSMGGDDSAPGPYILGFSAIASCFAMTLRMMAVRAGVAINSMTVDVEGDYDDRAFFDLADERTGYRTLRLNVDVDCDTDASEIEALIAEARRKSPWLNTFAHPNSVSAKIVGGDSGGHA